MFEYAPNSIYNKYIRPGDDGVEVIKNLSKLNKVGTLVLWNSISNSDSYMTI